MRVRRITAWLGIDRFVPAGEICEMPDELAALHIAQGGAELVDPPKAELAQPTIPAPTFAADDEPLVLDDPKPTFPEEKSKRKR